MTGTTYQKSPAGCLFYGFFGGGALKANVSVSVTKPDSLLGHTGPHLEAEGYITRTFGAKQSYMVADGTSTSNKIVGIYTAPAGSVLLVDHNYYKSPTHLLMMNDMMLVWLKPTHDTSGILDSVPRRGFTHASVERKVEEATQVQRPVHAVVINSAHDGLLYNTSWIR